MFLRTILAKTTIGEKIAMVGWIIGLIIIVTAPSSPSFLQELCGLAAFIIYTGILSWSFRQPKSSGL